MNDRNLNEYLSGNKIYGDEFSTEELLQWFHEEESAYFKLVNEGINYQYSYHALNTFHGFRFLPDKKFENVLSIGGAYGDELLPILDKINNVYILEATEAFNQHALKGKKVEFHKTDPLGRTPYSSNFFNLITCFGVLHHMANVTFILNEISRIMANGGYLILREPIVSMGNWELPRKGLTKNERGFPLKLFVKAIENAGFKILKRRPCVFPLTNRIGKWLHLTTFNVPLLVKLDHVFSILMKWNYKYHPVSLIQKLQPQSYFFVLFKV
jgi:SAM-dependent methyltransferase